jgi:hypothetical protein
VKGDDLDLLHRLFEYYPIRSMTCYQIHKMLVSHNVDGRISLSVAGFKKACDDRDDLFSCIGLLFS